MKQVPFGDIEKTLSTFSGPQTDDAPITSAKPGWNKEEALDRLGGDEDLLRELCQIFVDESPKLLRKLREAIACGDAESVMRSAHALKGELGYLGASRAVQAARELENMGHEKTLSRAAEVFTVLDFEFAALHIALKEFAGAMS